MEEQTNEYIRLFLEDKRFIRLLELKNEIDAKYASLILKFKRKEAQYSEAKSYESYYPNFEEIQKEFSQIKSELYAKEEVKEYFQLEQSLQESLNEDFNELKKMVSNKFHLTQFIKL